MREMKDSGIEWIGKIPSDWKVNKLKFSSKNREEKIANNTGSDYFALENVLGWNGTLIETENEYDTTGAICCKKGDVAFGKLRPYLAKVFHVDYDRCCSSEFAVFYDFNGISRYYFYIMLTKGFVNAVDISTYGVKMPRANVDFIKNMVIPIPPISEQQAIVEYLDKQCEELNNLISDLHHQIETLEEYKRSVITEAVTKGLDPDVEMRDSGVQWIGMMPTHWDCQRGKYILRYVQKPVRDDDGVITCFRDGEVTLRSNRREEGFTMADKEIGYQGIDVGDLVVHGMDGFAGAIGISDSRGKASPVLNVLDTEQNKRYIMYYLRSMAYNDVFVALATGIRVRSCDLRWNKLAELLYPMPPVEEQQVIVEHIDSVLERTNAIIADKKQQIETIEEYKKSLIFEYVTGKKEVTH